jgi:hypothetical protein
MNQCESVIWLPVILGIRDIGLFLVNVFIYALPVYLAYMAFDRSAQNSFLRRVTRFRRNIFRTWLMLKRPRIFTPIRKIDVFCIRSDFISALLWIALVIFSWWGNVICPLVGGAEWNSQYFIYSVSATFIYVLVGSMYVRRIKALSKHIFVRPIQYG